MKTDDANTGAPARNQRKLRNYLISPAFQWKYTGLVIVGVFLMSALLSVVLFGTLYQQARARVVAPATSHAWANTIVIVVASLSFSTVMALACGVWSIIVTHRIGGPLFVMERTLAELAAGRFPKHRGLRKKDEFKGLYDMLWRAIDASRARQQADFEALTQALDSARSLAAGGGQGRQEALDCLTVQLETLRNRAAEALGEKVDCTAEPAPECSKTVEESSEVCAGLPC
jgi:hypothetical protein